MAYSHCKIQGKGLALTLVLFCLVLAPSAMAAVNHPAGLDHQGYLPVFKRSAYYDMARGSAMLEAERPKAAIPLLEEAVEKNPTSVIAQYNLGYSLMQTAEAETNPQKQAKLRSQAEWAFLRARDLNPELSITYYKLGKLALLREDYQAASDYYASGVDAHPENFALWFNLAAAYEKINAPEKAERAYLEAIKINPQFVYAHNNLGLLYEQAEDYDKAEEMYREALNQVPDYNYARLNLGSLLQGEGRTEEAEALYQDALRYEPHNAWAYLYLGNIYFKQTRYAEALTAYNQAISLNPDYPTTYYLASLVLQRLNRPEEAMAKSLQYIALAPHGTFSQEANELVLTLQQSKRQATQGRSPL